MIGDQLITIEVGTETGKAYMRNTDTFAWRLRQQRDAMGITQFEMCDRIIAIIRRDEPEFSLSYPAYNRYETGDTATPRLNVLTAIREITGLSLDYLIAGEPEETGSEFATEEAEQIAVIVDSLPPDLRTARIDDMRANGLSYLSSEDVRGANAWLRDMFRLVIGRAPTRGGQVNQIIPLF